MTQNKKRPLILIIAGLALLKGLILFGVLPVFQQENRQIYNANLFPDGYDLIAENLLEGHGYRMYPETSETLIRTPGFVFILAGLFAIAGKSLSVIKAFNLLLSLGTGWLVYILAARLTGSRLTAIIASVIFLFFPGTVIAESRGGVEVTLAFCIVLFILLLYQALDSLAFRDFALAGAVLGFGLLVKSSLALVLPILFIFSAMRQRNRVSFWRLVGLFAMSTLVAALCLSPWIIRNYSLADEFVPTMTVGGLAAFQGLYVVQHHSTGKQHYELLDEAAAEQARIADGMGLRVKHGFFPQFYSAKDELRFYRALGDKAKAEYRKSPLLLVRVGLFNLWSFWFQGKTNRATILNMILTVPFLILVTIGSLAAFRRELSIGLLLIFVAAFVATHLPIMAMARYYIPLVPLLAIPAALPVASVMMHWGRRRFNN